MKQIFYFVTNKNTFELYQNHFNCSNQLLWHSVSVLGHTGQIISSCRISTAYFAKFKERDFNVLAEKTDMKSIFRFSSGVKLV